MTRDCKVKQRIKKLKMDENLKEQISKIILYDSSDTSSEEEEEVIYQNQETSSDSEYESCGCSNGNCDCKFTVNVIKKEATILLDLVEKIDNP